MFRPAVCVENVCELKEEGEDNIILGLLGC